MKFKRGISLALALALIAGIGGPLDIRAAAADTGSSDALAALGIDSSKAPDGFNANDPSNPYGRNTIKVTPVYELYTVGLTNDVLPSDKIDLDKREIAEQCDTSVSKSNQKDNILQSTLYGNDDNTSTKAQQFLTAKPIPRKSPRVKPPLPAHTHSSRQAARAMTAMPPRAI